VTLPALFAVAGMYLWGTPLWLTLALAVDVVTGRGRVLPRTRALLFFALYLACEVVGVVAAGWLWVSTAGGSLGGPARSRSAHAALQRWWTGALFHGACRLFSVRVEAEGLEHARTGPFLLLVRHSSTADTVLAAALLANPQKLLFRYVLKRELLWDPCLDLVGHRLPNAFIDRTGPRLEAERAAIERLAQGLGPDEAALIYPEGTRFSPQKLALAQQKLAEKGAVELATLARTFTHTLPPRPGGALALLRAAPGVDVVLMEHTGFEGAATFSRFWNGALVGRTLKVRVRRISAAQVPAEHRERWLFERWAEVDRWVAQHAPAEGGAR
jgi:1-acyl-sn-glycerol-3-phosphate acyltransferase